ncbi:MAG TPA: glycosyl hydrolase [Verrucomicrobiae bacterium]|mgnify:CR=1 FL=1|nr:glycosyl hydrolase [Verrucomicrobiae bacterium]
MFQPRRRSHHTLGSHCALLLATAVTLASVLHSTTLEEDFANPPRDARTRAYWWWLNGNVTKAAITRDLEQMASKGFGGALICDAGGYAQDGNDPVPAGPPFFSAEWRELYRHALREADRLGLEISLNIQSGWNLGGPMIRPDQAPKKLVWSEARATGPAEFDAPLPDPKHAPEFYHDIAVVAYPLRANASLSLPPNLRYSSEQSGHTSKDVIDGNPDTFWVSAGGQSGDGPTREKPQWLQLEFDRPVAPASAIIRPRPGYGPREGELRASTDGRDWRIRAPFKSQSEKSDIRIPLQGTPASHFRILVFRAFDPRFPEAPRNVQIAEIELLDKDGRPIFSARGSLQLFPQKAQHKSAGWSAPNCLPLMQDLPSEPGEEAACTKDIIDLTTRFSRDGRLTWNVPAGEWEILRFGCTLSDHCHVSTSSDTWSGYAIDPLDRDIFRGYWDAIVTPLIDDAGPLAGKVLKYLHTDSWEIEPFNWTPSLPAEFQKRRGYAMLPYFPVLAGRILDSRDASNRFLNDFRKTLGDLIVDNHFRPFSEWAKARGISIHPESGGPHAVPIDSLRCLGVNDVPMSEFWAKSWRHRTTDQDRFFVKQPASAAHTYGHRIVAAEGFTTIGPHWQEVPSNNLKPSFDRALCEGLNLLVWHQFTCSPKEMGLPGQEYFAGTHFNPNATWWPKCAPFIAYLNRCQAILQRGLFVADACYYYGDHVPNFTQLKASDPAGVRPGHDYDVATEEVVLTRMSVRDGQIILPDGMRYRALVLPDLPAISLPVLRKVEELIAAGATVIGPRPQRANSLSFGAEADAEVARIASELWGTKDPRNGHGRLISRKTAREVFASDGVPPDFEAKDAPAIDYIHRREGETDIYFVSSPSEVIVDANCLFRVTGKAPELWDPVHGTIRDLPCWSALDGRTEVPIRFEPYGAMFIVFRKPTVPPPPPSDTQNFPTWRTSQEISGPWRVTFDPALRGPGEVEFPNLVSWTSRPEEGIRFYSGTATYRTIFSFVPDRGTREGTLTAKSERSRVCIDLGNVHELAEIRLNKKSLGILWSIPFRADVTGALREGRNDLEIDVVNFWPNRVIGDASLPEPRRLTTTNIRKLTPETPLVESGLLGPVTLLMAEPSARP